MSIIEAHRKWLNDFLSRSETMPTWFESMTNHSDYEDLIGTSCIRCKGHYFKSLDHHNDDECDLEIARRITNT